MSDAGPLSPDVDAAGPADWSPGGRADAGTARRRSRWNPGRPPAAHGGWDASWFFLAALVAYAFTSPGATGYDQYARFAQVMLHGSLSLPSRPPHLEMAEFAGRAYFSNPPTPALLLLPFVWLAEREPLKHWLLAYNGGWELPLGLMQAALSILLGAINVALARIGLGRVPLSRRAANWGAVLFGFGSIHWYHATIGSVWYIAQIAHATFMWLLVVEWLGKARPVLLGVALAAAFWCRMETMLAVPFVLMARPDRWLLPRADELLPRLRLGWLVRFGVPLVGVLTLNALYNWARFGTFSNYAYTMLIEKPEVRGMFPYGLLSWHYWWGHVQTMFNSWPIVEPGFPWVRPRISGLALSFTIATGFPWVMPKVSGLAIWITTPAFVYALRAPLDHLTGACWVGIALFMSLLLQHCGTGMTQLGYRFAMDFYPLLVLLTMRGMDPPLRWWKTGLIAVSVFINAWCVWVLNILQIQRLF